MIVARLPNIKVCRNHLKLFLNKPVQVLNGGDPINGQERDEAERSFIRYFLDIQEEKHPKRVSELVAVHGNLDPLVKIDLSPEFFFKVTIYYGDQARNMTVSVRQRVKHFKSKLQQLFHLSPCSMRVWYYDQEMYKVAGPEEMKWPMKGLYTYDIQDGDYFVVEEKQGQKCMGSPCKAKSYSRRRKNLKQELEKNIGR